MQELGFMSHLLGRMWYVIFVDECELNPDFAWVVVDLHACARMMDLGDRSMYWEN